MTDFTKKYSTSFPDDLWARTLDEICLQNFELIASLEQQDAELATLRAECRAVRELLSVALDKLSASVIRERHRDARIRHLTTLAKAVRLAA
jgi:hypothetical protein